MPTSIFKIYDGRTNFWQWDTNQKLIVLDEKVTEVHFSNRDMKHSITKYVYELEGKRVCNVPDVVLQLPRNLVAYAYANGSTVKSVKIAVIQRPIPEGYIMDKGEQIDEIERRLEVLENVLKDIAQNGTTNTIKKFTSLQEATKWAQESKQVGSIVAVRLDGKWIAHMVEEDFSVTPICNCSGEMVEIDIFDGGDSDGYTPEEELQVTIWDGGNARGY